MCSIDEADVVSRWQMSEKNRAEEKTARDLNNLLNVQYITPRRVRYLILTKKMCLKYLESMSVQKGHTFF